MIEKKSFGLCNYYHSFKKVDPKRQSSWAAGVQGSEGALFPATDALQALGAQGLKFSASSPLKVKALTLMPTLAHWPLANAKPHHVASAWGVVPSLEYKCCANKSSFLAPCRWQGDCWGSRSQREGPRERSRKAMDSSHLSGKHESTV